jgi:tetratricopeptide (TPR) repeat protein
MGFRLSKSFKLAPGVRMTVSRSGVGYSVGTRGARVTRTARGRVVSAVGLPGTGFSYSTSVSRSRSTSGRPAVAQPKPPAPPKPGLFADKAEKELYKALIEKPDVARLSQIAAQHPAWMPLCATLEGLLAYQAKEVGRAEAALVAALQSGQDVASHPFVQKYVGGSTVTLEVADGVDVTMPLGREAVGLTLAELLQGTDRLSQAIEVVEQLEPTFSAALSLAELYSEAARHDEVIAMTNGLTNDTDAHAFLLVLRARAFRQTAMFDAARETLKEALRRRTVDAEIRRRAYLERANTYLGQNRRAQARKDLERVMAEDANYPGLAEAMAALDSEISSIGAAETEKD